MDCSATDVCVTDQGLFFTYNDYNADLAPAHACIKVKCTAQWNACDDANLGYDGTCHDSVVAQGQ